MLVLLSPGVLVDSYWFLKSTYHSTTMPIYFEPGIFHGAKTFINLALVHREHETWKKREEAIVCQIRSNTDETQHKKTSLKLSDIGWITDYSSEEKNGYRCPSQEILIEGAPGVGKTTLAWHLCQKWEKRKLLEQW